MSSWSVPPLGLARPRGSLRMQWATLSKDGAFVVNDPMGFGALEVFLMARNLNLSGMTISSDLMTEFLAAVKQANNQIVDRTDRSVARTGI